MISRSLKSLWHSDVIFGATVGAVTSGLLVVLALVLAPMLSGSTERPTSGVGGGVATVPPSAQGLASAEADDDRARDRDRDRPSVTRGEDTSSLPSAAAPSRDHRSSRRPSSGGDDTPIAPQTTIEPVPVEPSAAAGAGATPGIGQALTPSPVRAAMRLRVKAASFGRDSGQPQLKLTMGVTPPAPAAAPVPEQVTVTLRPDVPSHPEREAAPLALQAHVDVVDGPSETSTQMGLRVRMSLAPATADLPTIDESAEGDGRSNVVKLAIPLTAFAEHGEATIPGVPALPAETPAEGKDGDDDGKPAEAPSAETPGGTPVGYPAPDPAPSKPTTPAEPATPTEPTTPSDPTTPSEPSTPSEPPAELPMTEIQVPLIVTPEPITTVEKTVLPLPPAVDPDAKPADGLRVTVAIQNALTDTPTGDKAAHADPATPAEPAPATEPAPSTEPSSDAYGAPQAQHVSDTTAG